MGPFAFGRTAALTVLLLGGMVPAAAAGSEPMPEAPFIAAVDIAGQRATDLWLVGVQRDPLQVTSAGGSENVPVWSPDGSRIAFVSGSDQSAFTRDLWLADADGSSRVRLTEGFPYRYLGPVSWSPDGRLIAMARQANPDASDAIWVFRADGTRYWRVVSGLHLAAEPLEWSPDSTQLVFESNQQIYRTDLHGRTVVPLTTGPDSSFGPAWSPDGSAVLYTSGGSIWEVRPDGSDNHLFLADAAGPVWSPDGEQVLVTLSGADGGVAVASRSGGVLERLTPDPAEYGWSPEGSAVYLRHLAGNDPGTDVVRLDGTGAETVMVPPGGEAVHLSWRPRPCSIVGTDGDDTLTGTSADDVICGLGGDDTLNGGGGRDVLVGGPGNDLVRGGAGADRLVGSVGVDVLQGGADADRIIATDLEPNDSVAGGGGADVCDGDGGDTISGC